MKFLVGLLTLIARFGFAALFLGAAANNFLQFDETSQYIASKGLPMVPLLIVGASILEIVGGVFLLLGYRTRLGATILILFLLPTTLIFHDFWNAKGEVANLEQIEFLKNIAVLGGLLYVLSYGSGLLGFDSCRCGKKREETPPTPTPTVEHPEN